MRRNIVVVLSLACSLLLWRQEAQATESASSYYFPGGAGSFAVAVAPDPGFAVANQMLFYHAEADTSVLRGRVNLSIEADAFYNYIGGFHTFEEPVLGGRLQVGAAIPVGSVDVYAGIDTTLLGSRSVSDTSTNIGDSVAAAALYWNSGNFHFKLGETVYVPTGDYNTGNLANVGRNYWGFDTSFALTWLNMKTGTEVSVVPGILFNTENTATDYHSGNEFHVDFMVNQFLAKNFAVGVQGYRYEQVSGDSGSGARLGSFKGESLGAGPALLWMPSAGNGKLSLVAKWIRDVDHENRMQGDYGQFIVGYKF